MSTRIQIKKVTPHAYRAMMALEDYVGSAELPPAYRDLIKIRTSQINGCAFCIDMHTEEARQRGESERRIYALSAWRESHLFSEEEKAILAATEEITRISEGGVSDATYDRLTRFFDDHLISDIIMTIVLINSWNRIAVTSRSIFKP